MLATKNITAEELYKKLKNIKIGGTFCHFSLKKCQQMIPLIHEILELKEKKNAIILTHTYVSPEIIYSVGDFVGDSFELSKKAMETRATTIVFTAVRFMGETAKILNPDKEVLIPSNYNGCDLADDITAEKVRELKKQFPDYTFVCYINTTAPVKAECDVCVTSGNVYKVVERIPNDKIYFLPDEMMGLNLIEEFKKKDIKKDIKFYTGSCCVHKEYTLEDVLRDRIHYPKAQIISHPECKPEVCQNSDFVGSTSQMLNYLKDTSAEQFIVLTECGLSARVKAEHPDKNLVGMCTLCPFMKANRLEDILRVLKNPTNQDRVILDKTTIEKARRCLEKMFEYSK